MILTLSGAPLSTNHLYKRHGHIIYMTTEGKQKKEQYQWEAKSQWRGAARTDDITLVIHLYFKDKLRRDWDNWHKATMDSLTGIVWKDDCQIQDARVIKHIDPANPRVEIEIL